MAIILYFPLCMLTTSPISYVSCIYLSVNTIVIFSCYCVVVICTLFPLFILIIVCMSPYHVSTGCASCGACPSSCLPFTGPYPSLGRASPSLPFVRPPFLGLPFPRPWFHRPALRRAALPCTAIPRATLPWGCPLTALPFQGTDLPFLGSSLHQFNS